MEYVVELVARQAEPTAVIRGEVAHGEVGPFIGAALEEVVRGVGTAAITGPPFCRMDMAGDRFALEVGFPVGQAVPAVGRIVASSLPGGTTATLLYAGPYEGIAPAYGFLEGWLREHGLAPAGAPWEQYLDGPEVPEPRTIVCWPCRELPPGP